MLLAYSAAAMVSLVVPDKEAVIKRESLVSDLGFAASSLTNTFIMFGVYLVLFIAYNIFLFRRRIFRKKYAEKPEEVWTE